MKPDVRVKYFENKSPLLYFENSCLFIGKFLADIPLNTPIRIYNKEHFFTLFGNLENIIPSLVSYNGYNPDLNYPDKEKRLELYKNKIIDSYNYNLTKENIFDYIDNDIDDPFSHFRTKNDIDDIIEDYLHVLNFLSFSDQNGLLVIRYEDDLDAAFDNIVENDDYWVEMFIATKRTYKHALNKFSKQKVPVIYGLQPENNFEEFYIKNKNLNKENLCVTIGTKRNKINGKNFNTSLSGYLAGFRSYLINNSNIGVSHCKLELSDKLNEVAVPSFFKNNKNYKDKLYDAGLNFLEYFKNQIVVCGEQCGQKNLTEVLVINRVKRNIIEFLKKYTFEYNNESVRWNVKCNLEKLLQIFKDARLLNDFMVVCDNKNNKDDNILNCDVYIKPLYIIEFIELRFSSDIG